MKSPRTRMISISALKLHVTFICGRAGVCALSAVAAKNAGDHALLNHYLSQFKAMYYLIWPSFLLGVSGLCMNCHFIGYGRERNHQGWNTIS
ncbi:lanC-like protein GCR2 [Magnolia sinica]|uniref:lanC-like protein GCR2 n=1 Tax=Magnolia sinica TaxID=86752 RepID=UPI00265B33D7|nr:lanC-like protein GCR2 [Magnolia sinica]